MRKGTIGAIKSWRGVLLREALREIEGGPPPVFFLELVQNQGFWISFYARQGC